MLKQTQKANGKLSLLASSCGLGNFRLGFGGVGGRRRTRAAGSGSAASASGEGPGEGPGEGAGGSSSSLQNLGNCFRVNLCEL